MSTQETPEAKPPQVETLVQFFGLEEPFKAEEERTQNAIEALANSGASNALSMAFALVPAPLHRIVAESLGSALKVVLKTPLKQIMAKAWNMRRDLLQYCDRAKFPPEELIPYALKENAISYKYKPSVQLMLNDKALGPAIKFEIAVALISEPVLKIRDAHVVGASVGTIQGKGSVACEGAILVERKSEKFTLARDFSFGRGFAIGRPLGKDVAGDGAPNWWSRAISYAQGLVRKE